MKESLKRKLYELAARHEEIAHLLGTPEIINDQDKFRRLNQEYSQLTPVAEGYLAWQKTSDELAELRAWRDGNDPELREMAQSEWENTQSALTQIESNLQTHLVPRDPLDDSNIFLEIRAAAGGDESAIFAGDLFRMYSKYAETCGWQIEILNANLGEHGGYKEIISRIEGFGAYSRLKFESGAHRVQRVPETESQGRVHTSTCTVAVLPELAEVEKIDINPADLKIDTFRASGAGGQHVNKTDSAIRITHLPSGMVVECQEERSQHKNRARAMSLLASRLLEIEQRKQSSEISENRRKLVGTGDRSERIRTYNYAQGRVSDHRINLTLYKLPAVLEGDLDDVINPLLAEDQAERLAALGE